MHRRSFLTAALGAALAAPLVGSRAFARGDDKPRVGKGKNDEPAEVNGKVTLPAWPHGGTSTAKDAMLMFRGDPTHTFYGSGEIPGSKPEVLWKHRMEDFPSLYYGEPFVWKGTGWTGQAVAYAGHVWIGSQGRNLYCFEAKTGTLKWRYQASRQFKGSSCLWDNKLYIGNVDDWLRCFDAATGKVLWRLNTGYDLDSSPCVVDGRLYIAGENGNVRCLDPHTGEKHWKAFVGGINRGKKTGSYGSETSPAVVGDEVYAATYDGELFCLDKATGKKRWMSKTGDDTDSSPVVSGELVYAAAQDKSPYLYAFKRQDGAEVWKHKGKGGYWGTPAVVGDRLFIGAAGGKLDCLDKKTGKVLWGKALGHGTWSSPTVVGDKLVIGDMGGTLHCVAVDDGRELWTMKLGGRIHSTAIVYEGRLFVGTTDGSFFGIGKG